MRHNNLNFINYFRIIKKYFTELFCSKDSLRDTTTIINDTDLRKYIILIYLQRVYNIDFSLLKMQMMPAELQDSLKYHGNGRYSLDEFNITVSDYTLSITVDKDALTMYDNNLLN